MATNRVSFDIFRGQTLPWSKLLEDVLYFEEIGMGTAWILDHYGLPTRPDAAHPEAWTTLAALAAQTTRIRLGTAVTNVATRHPAILAKQAATVDCISGGRLDIGLGAGYYEEEHRWLGIPYLAPGERVERLRETVEVIDGLLREHQLTYNGKYVNINSSPFAPVPVQQPRPPLAIAADGKKALRIVADVADIWLTLGSQGAEMAQSLASVRERNLLLDDFCMESGRDPRSIQRAYFMGWAAEYPFASLAAFQDLIGRYREAGIERFIMPFARSSQSPKAVASGLFIGREALEGFALDAIASMRDAG